MDFDGATYSPSVDGERLKSQLERVKSFMADEGWHTLPDIAMAAGGSTAGVSARLRDLRKMRFGGFQVNRRRIPGTGLFEYQLLTK